MQNKNLKLLLSPYAFIVILRILVPFLVFPVPVYAAMLSTFLDLIDAEFASEGVLTKAQYQIIDKALDYWWYLIALIFSYFGLTEYFSLLFFLFSLRTVGFLIFLINRKRVVLFLFPNFFENIFLFLLFAKYVEFLSFLLTGPWLYLSVLMAIVLKYLQEWFIHIADLSFREHIFKFKPRSWK